MALDRNATLDSNATIGRSKAGNGATGAKSSASVLFGRLVAARRLEVGLSQEELAERMGTSQSHVASIEAGQPIGTATRELLTSALGMEPEPNPLRRLMARAASGGNGARIPAEPIGRRFSDGLSATRQTLGRPVAALDLERAKAALGKMPERARAFDGLGRARAALSRVPIPAQALDGARIPRRAALALAAAAVIAFLLSLLVVDAAWARIGLTAVTVSALWLSMLLVRRQGDARVPVAIAAAVWLAVIAVGVISNGGNAEGDNSPAIKTASAATSAPDAATLAQNGTAAATLASDAAAASRENSVATPKSHSDSTPSDTTADQPISSNVVSSTPSTPSTSSSSGGKPGAKPGNLSDNQGGSSGSGSTTGSTGASSGGSASSGGGPIGNIVNSLGNAHGR